MSITTLEAAPAGKSVPPYVGRPLPRRPPPAFTADLLHILRPWYGSGGRSQTIGAAGRLSGRHFLPTYYPDNRHFLPTYCP